MRTLTFTYTFPTRTLAITAHIGTFSMGETDSYAVRPTEFLDDLTAIMDDGEEAALSPAEFEEVWVKVQGDLGIGLNE